MLMAAAECGNDYACKLVEKLGLEGFWAATVQFLLIRHVRRAAG